ncbi:hypothetical protein MtrunA17_Chr2g0328041 [Medicago truncatula]|uniref:Transmembrane protein n=1 Tax=Medicago truncatula TaxID=3880 RepID=I3S390_MEDTR|nr:unknown [Medicago truncatula]RHN76070.1 hypothetical protein MtrunA17_Chr2g0328041 [Medicago truncatula]
MESLNLIFLILSILQAVTTLATVHHSLSIHSAATLPELRPPNFPNDTLDNPLKLLLPLSFKFRSFLDLFIFEQLISTLS